MALSNVFLHYEQDLSSMIRNKLNLVIFLINNDGYTIERVILDGPFNDIQPW